MTAPQPQRGEEQPLAPSPSPAFHAPESGGIKGRNSYQGMLQILEFNWPWYAVVLAMLLLACGALASLSLSPWMRRIITAGMGCATLWAGVSLFVSHWIYDRSPLRRWDWIAGRLASPPSRAAN